MDNAEQRVRQFLQMAGAREPAIKRIVLFGSRARGGAGERSDFDVAVDAPKLSDAAWARWALEVREGVPTLCGLDLVRLEPGMSAELAQRIREEGVEIYVRG